MTTVNDAIHDAETRHAIGLQRLSNATVRKIVALLRRVDGRIAERLLSEDLTTIGRTRQRELLDALKAIVDSVYTDATGQLQIDLELLAAYEGDYQAELLVRLVPVPFETVKPSAAQIIAAVNSRPFQGRILREWFRDIEADAFARVRNAIRMGIVEGRTTEQMVRELRGTRSEQYRNGILEISRRQAVATVRTAVNHTATVARESLWKGMEHLIKGVQWSSTLDGRTSAVCRARDGKVYEVDKGPRPPAHPNCRSSIIPVVKSLREMGMAPNDLPPGTRASMNGQVAADTTYGEWLARQDVGFQDEVLGVAKARLFRQGGLSMDRFVDRAGREYTLDELRRREADAWQRTFATSS